MRSCKRLIAAAAAFVFATFTLGGCYTAGAPYSFTREKPEPPRTVPNGSVVSLALGEGASKDGLSLTASESRKCRTVQRVGVERLQKTTHTWHSKVDFVGTLGGVGVIPLALGLFGNCEPDKSDYEGCKETKSQALLAGGIAVGLAAVLAFVPKSYDSEEVKEARSELRWATERATCGGVPPAPIAGYGIDLRASFAGSGASLGYRVTTGQGGTAELTLASPALVAAWCGDATLTARGAAPGGEPRDGPEAPDVSRREANTPPIAIRAARRGTISEIRAIEPAAAKIALECCASRARDAEREGCVQLCAKAGEAERCYDAYSQGRMRAQGADDTAAGMRHVDALYEECLVGRGTSRQNMDRCTAVCLDKKIEEACR